MDGIFSIWDAYLLGASTLVGLMVGSFLNVVICRLPMGQSVVRPGSHCPLCNTPVRWYDNVPVLAWLWLGGKCRACKVPISIEYPLVELANGVLWGLLAWRFGLSPQTFVYMVLASALLTGAMIDLHHQILPDRITLPGIVLGLIASATLLPQGILPSVIGALAGGGLFFLIAVLSRGGMGGGDIKLIAMIGAFLGWQSVLLTVFLAAVVGGTVGALLMLIAGKGRKHAVPFGPFLSAGAIFCMLWGPEVIDWYMGLSQP
ncbi:MAG: prepilin peptidase [Leptospirillia bacterium]